MLIHGIHRFGGKYLAFRMDYCLTCKGLRWAFLIRSFRWFHIYWIPLIPLGYDKSWQCVICANDPQAPTKTRLIFKLLAVLALSVLSLAAIVSSKSESMSANEDQALRLGIWVSLLAAVVWTIRHKPELNRKQTRALAPITPVEYCPGCEGSMIRGQPDYCQSCGLQHLPRE
ncbi:MAG: hypothetical protein R3F17_04695 [Planctomycetota bacterium]